jgi:D-aspartate ligase
VLRHTALGLALALLAVFPLARKWELPTAGVVITLTVAAVVAGLVVEVFSGTISLSSLQRSVLVAALALAQGVAFLAYRFFRDPERVPVLDPGTVVSPADGEVRYVSQARAGVLPVASKHGRDYKLEELTRTHLAFSDAVVIGIAMSFSDVHVNRAPIAGTVTLRRHFPGRFGSLGRPGLVFENERATTVVEGGGLEIAVVQIASRLVRQITSFVKQGQRIGVGERIGVIRFGSQVDVVLPLTSDVEILVTAGERVRAGESVIAWYPRQPVAKERVPRESPRTSSDAQVGAVVLGGEYRALGIARSLGRRGIPVWIVHGPVERMAVMSRYCRRSISWPTADEHARADFLADLCSSGGLKGWVLFPTDDDTTVLIARHADRLSGYALTTPGWEFVRQAHDKRLTYKLAAAAGIAHPRTFYPGSREDLESLDLEFPVILKPAVKESPNRFTRAKAWPAIDRRELMALYDEAARLVPPTTIMVQELLPGGGEAQFSFAALCEDGRPIASVVARRLRQYPVDFGRSSSCVETVDEPEVVREAERFLASFRYSGLVEVEFKRDPRDGSLRLLDVNPRVWTWHTLAAGAGVDFSYLQWRLSRGQAVPRSQARPGVRWIRPATDALAATQLVLTRGESARVVAKTYWRAVEMAPFAFDDPLPALTEMPMAAATRLLRRRTAVHAPSRPDADCSALVP